MTCCRVLLLLAAALMPATTVRAAPPADAASGGQVFAAQCAACHAVTAGPEKIGPSLAGVVGRPAGSVPGFRYSPGSRRTGLVFDEVTLDRYLTNPQAIVPGTVMAYPGLKDPTKRRDLIAFLAEQK